MRALLALGLVAILMTSAGAARADDHCAPVDGVNGYACVYNGPGFAEACAHAAPDAVLVHVCAGVFSGTPDFGGGASAVVVVPGTGYAVGSAGGVCGGGAFCHGVFGAGLCTDALCGSASADCGIGCHAAVCSPQAGGCVPE